MAKLPDYWDTMKQAAAALGSPISLLKKAKGAGCPAFRGSRVYRKELEVWIKQNRGTIAESRSKEDVQIEKLIEECRKLRLQNDVRENSLVMRQLVAESNTKVASDMRLFLYQKLCNEIAPESRNWGIKTYDEFCEKAQMFAGLWD